MSVLPRDILNIVGQYISRDDYISSVAIGDVQKVDFFHTVFGFGEVDVLEKGADSLVTAVQNRQVGTLEYLLSRLSNPDPAVVERIFWIALKAGYSDVLKVLSRYDKEPAVKYNSWALRLVVENNHTHVLHTLASHYDLGVDNARAVNNEAFWHAIKHNQPECLRILARVYGLTEEDARTSPDGRIRQSTQNPSLRPLLQSLGIYARHTHDHALRWASVNGMYDIVDVLLTDFGVGISDVRADNHYTLHMTASMGHCSVLKLLIEKCSLTKEDVYSSNFCAMRWAIANERCEVASFLASLYNNEE